jgi:hypothetical protein
VAPSPKNTGTPRLGDNPADLCKRVDRMGTIEQKIDTLIKSQSDIIRCLDALEKGDKARK